MASFPGGSEYGGMHARVTETLRRMYDSVVWVQRASRFLGAVSEKDLEARIRAVGTTRVKEELQAQLEEVGRVRQRRDDTMARITATATGIDTLAVKVQSIALDAASPDQGVDEVRALREELDAYDAGLAELEQHLREILPESR
jgi:limonene-1,2-epoxide hydrolase